MAETLETLAKRVIRLEKVIAEMTLQLSVLVSVVTKLTSFFRTFHKPIHNRYW